MGSLTAILVLEWPLALDIQSLANRLVRLDLSDSGRIFARVKVWSTLGDQILQCQFEDPSLVDVRDRMLGGETSRAALDSNGSLRYNNRICDSRVGDLVQIILREAHCSGYSIYPGTTKMYRDLRQIY